MAGPGRYGAPTALPMAALLAVALLLGACGKGSGDQDKSAKADRKQSETPAASPQVVEGAGVFQHNCRPCHIAAVAQNLVGPTLHGVVGRKAGTVPDFTYSDAMRHSGLTWTEANLARYIADPQAVVPGNHMPFPGLKDPQQVKALIAYLKALAQPPQQK